MTVPVFEEQIPPSTEPYGVLADAEAEAQEAVEESTVAQILLAWYIFSGEDDGGHGVFYDGARIVSFADEVAQLIRSAQREAGAITESYIRSSVEQMHEDFDLPDRILLPRDPIVDLPGDLRLGAGTEDVYQRPIRKLRYLASEGQPLESVLPTVEQRIESQARTDLQLARAISMQQVMYRFPHATGWRRIIHPELGNVCGLCIAASDRIYTRLERMDLHPACRCTCLPIVLGVDPGKAVNADDLSRLYEAAGDTTDSRALSKLRVQVRQNGELGPILTADGTHFTSRQERARQLSPAAAEQRRLSIESQLTALRAKVAQSPNQWYSDRIEQLEELAAA